jgi:uncharacterized membrane protein
MYQYIYYRLYTWNRNKWGDSDIPEYNAAIGMSLIFVCNIMSLNIIVYLLSNFSFVSADPPKKYSILLLLIIYAFHHFVFLHKKKYLEIVQQFQSEDEKKRKRNGVLVFLYSVGSPLVFIFLMFFGIWLKH